MVVASIANGWAIAQPGPTQDTLQIAQANAQVPAAWEGEVRKITPGNSQQLPDASVEHFDSARAATTLYGLASSDNVHMYAGRDNRRIRAGSSRGSVCHAAQW